MFTAMRMLGFDKIFDVNFGADLTIMEEAHELLHRVKHGGTLPMFTSCSPGWIRYIEYYYPELIPNLSSCKSPMQMFGATVKTYWAQKEGIDPKNIYVVGVMPCTAKKFERTREHENASGYPDIDAVLTTRELAKMIKTSGMSSSTSCPTPPSTTRSANSRARASSSARRAASWKRRCAPRQKS